MGPRRHFDSEDDEEKELLIPPQEEPPRVQQWNRFKDAPTEQTVGSEVDRTYIDLATKALKVITIFVVFLVVLSAAVVSKGTTLFMTSQINNLTRRYCNKALDRNLLFEVTLPDIERVAWFWLLIFAYWIPEVGTFIRSIRKCLFKKWDTPSFSEFIPVFILELVPAIGSAIFIFLVLPELDVVRGAMLTNAVCFIPGVMAALSRNSDSPYGKLKLGLDMASVGAQATFIIWPVVEGRVKWIFIPISLILISLGWWENYVSKTLSEFITKFARSEFDSKTYAIYCVVVPLKCAVFLGTALVIFSTTDRDVSILFTNFTDSFQDHIINISEVSHLTVNGSDWVLESGRVAPYTVTYMTSIWVWLINIAATYVCYAFGKFSCKIMIQELGFALPLNLSVPVLLTGLIAMSGVYNRDECAFTDSIPPYLFFNTPLFSLADFVGSCHAWVWLLWLLSQAWITVHLWYPKCARLSSTEQLFVKPMYDAFFIDQSLAMNRRRHESSKTPQESEEQNEVTFRDLDAGTNPDTITRIYMCGTMWHETREEMIEFLKSVMRMDQDQYAHTLVRDWLKIDRHDYYELETHIFFDDAFVRTSEDDDDPHVNSYVDDLVSVMDEAASKVHGTKICIAPPEIYKTPYGGQLMWVLPGKTKMIAHLKDKKKIRAKKRWSQCMYMYYLLGFKLHADETLNDDSKETRSQNTYILALDGDIDFQPSAVHLLVDYMKKNKSLAAACGRIHPIGSGGMAWYQMFEYAIGHWLQKATEHVIGCVLCSPGCFSLFRANALMDINVMKKYTTQSSQATHYVQYDQGEDRWLCTLLLQRGWRVEYSAASDAFTHCPEGFNEFYKQRRRWVPSTMANILDLLSDYQRTIAINDNISRPYIFYQFVLLIGTIIGPGAIFLMLVGAFVTVFGLGQWSSLLWNLVPIVFFIVLCATCSSDIQLLFASIISAIYGLVMMAVLVGVILQINDDGALAPSSLFVFCLAGEFLIAALLHPQEFNCLKYGIIYYVTIPSMYMLLLIYSVFNMNDVSWGTRDVTVVSTKAPEAAKKQEKKNKIMRFLGADGGDNTGSWEFSVSKLFKCMCCTYRTENKENAELNEIQESMQQLLGTNPTKNAVSEDKTLEVDVLKAPEVRTESNEMKENSWFYDGDLINGRVQFLSKKEKTFWKDLIKTYLYPYEDDKKKVSTELKDLRDKMVFSFLMLNALFILIIFLLTLQKDVLNIQWPLHPKVNFTYNLDRNEVFVHVTPLQLEPIGFVFLIFFGVIMVIQFLAMLVHRFGTYSQIMTKTRLDWSRSSIDKSTEGDSKTKDPLAVARYMQNLKGINDPGENAVIQPVETRKTLSMLIPRESTINPVYFLADAVNARKQQMDQEDASEQTLPDAGQHPNEVLRRQSIAFIKSRMSMIERRKTLATKLGPQNGNSDSAFIDVNDRPPIQDTSV